MPTPSATRQRSRGYTFVEVVGLVSVIGSMGVMRVGGSPASAKGDNAMRVVVSQLNAARSMSISQRRPMEVQFVAPNEVRIVRRDGAAAMVVSSASFEDGLAYGVMPNVPDTPDGFGNGSGIDFGTATTVRFDSNGTLVDQNRIPRRGTVFFGIPNEAQSFRAVTITGETGRIRGYKWNAAQWN